MEIIESKGGEKECIIANLILKLAKKHNVKQELIMIGFADSDNKDLYVWQWKPYGTVGEQFKTLEVINLPITLKQL